MSKPWDKLPGETAEEYSRFLVYRNLGPKRSMRKAYGKFLRDHDGFTGDYKRLHCPSSWIRDAVEHFWRERAFGWDVRNLAAYGGRVAALHAEAVAQIARKNLRWARKLNPGDDGWSDLMRSMQQVQTFLTPELLRGIEDRNKSAGEPAPAAAGRESVE